MIKLELPVEDINKILSALGTQPFIQVNDLIVNIQTMANAQLAEEKKKEEKRREKGTKESLNESL